MLRDGESSGGPKFDGRGGGQFSLADNEDRLAWIFGSSRSGSSWLLRMLGDLDEVVPIDDPHLGHHLGVWRPIPLAWATAEQQPELRTLAEIKRGNSDFFFADRYREAWLPALRTLICRRFEAQAADVLGGTLAERRPMIVVKEPGGSHVADWIMSMFPRGRLVFLLRDGRDVVDSWLDAYQSSSWAVEGGAYPLAPEGRLAFIRWQATVWLYRTEAVQRAYRAHAPDRKALVRYEDMLDDAEPGLRTICAKLGVAVEPARLEAITRRHAYGRVPSSAKGEGQAIRSAAPGTWRENMNAREIAAMHEIIGAKLNELGYLSAGELEDMLATPVR